MYTYVIFDEFVDTFFDKFLSYLPIASFRIRVPSILLMSMIQLQTKKIYKTVSVAGNKNLLDWKLLNKMKL